MVNADLEDQLAALPADAAPETERAILEVYADWLEEQGHADMAHALRVYQPDGFRPVSIAVADDPLPPKYGLLRVEDVTLPLELFVIDQFLPRADPRLLDDRRDSPLTDENFDKRLAEHQITVSLDLAAAGIGDQQIEVQLRRLGDFEPDALATQLSRLGVAAPNLQGALRALFEQEPLRTVERTWRSLRWLLDRIREPVRVAIVNASAEDLIAEFEDAPTNRHAHIHRMVNYRNHPGMTPSGAIVLGPQLPRERRGFYLLRQMAEVARRKALPLITAAHPEMMSWAELATEPAIGRHAIIATPSFVLRRAHPFEAAALEGSASYLVAARMADAFSRHWGGGGLCGALRGVDLTHRGGRSHSIVAATRGFTQLIARDGDTHLTYGATASPSSAGSRSLDLHIISCRLALQLQNYHYAHFWGAEDPELRAAEYLAAQLESGLRRRLIDAHDFRVSLVDARFEEEPGFDFAGALEVGLSLELPSRTGSGVVRHVERMTVRLGF
ncbi:MAG: type VI secretion system contractile sheath large subunit [Polyangiaceae bacterium]